MISSAFSRAFVASALSFAFAAQTVQGQSSAALNQVVIYSLDQEDEDVPLLTTIEDLPRYFEYARNEDGPHEFPSSFSFPKSYQYEMTFGLVTNANKKQTIFEGWQQAVFDAENNRVRIERENRVFRETDTQVRVYDFDKMRLLVSDPVKKMCLMQKIADISPVSMVPREHDQIEITEAMQSLWVHPATARNTAADLENEGNEQMDWSRHHADQRDSLGNKAGQKQAKTTYLGEHKINLRDTSKVLLDSEYFHIFANNYSFLDLETKYARRGGVDGATTLYMFRENVTIDEDDTGSSNDERATKSVWQLAAVATKYKNQKPDVYCNLGNSFYALDQMSMETNEFQLKFYQKECHQYLDEYMLIDGNQLVKKVGTHHVLQ